MVAGGAVILLGALLISGGLVAASGVWLCGGRPRRSWQPSRHRLSADEALRRHPAGRGRLARREAVVKGRPDTPGAEGGPAGPDDDADFISALERLIRGGEQGGPGTSG